MAHPTVFRDGTNGLMCRCVNCDEWFPYWGARVIAIGKLIRIPNPRYGLPLANGTIDDRERLTLPKMRRGYGCPACAEEYDAFVRTTPRGRTPWIPHMDDGDGWLFDADRPIPSVVTRTRVLGKGRR